MKIYNYGSLPFANDQEMSNLITRIWVKSKISKCVFSNIFNPLFVFCDLLKHIYLCNLEINKNMVVELLCFFKISIINKRNAHFTYLNVRKKINEKTTYSNLGQLICHCQISFFKLRYVSMQCACKKFFYWQI